MVLNTTNHTLLSTFDCDVPGQVICYMIAVNIVMTTQYRLFDLHVPMKKPQILERNNRVCEQN